jgi:hypothetical protein
MDEFSLSNPINKDPNRQGRLVFLPKDDPRYLEGELTMSVVLDLADRSSGGAL